MVRAPSFPHLVEGSLGSSLEAFLDAAEAFFSNLAAVHWGALALGLTLHLLHQLCRSRAWFNTLRAAYPHERFEWRRIAGAQLVGVGINSITPARAGDVAKIYLARHSIPNSSYPTVTSSFVVDSVFDMPVGLLVLLYAITQGAVPSLDVLPSLPAFDLSFWADHPRFALFTITAVVVGLLVLYAVLSIRAVEFWRRVRQGVVILTDFRRYLRQVASWMATAWVLRFAAFWFFLDAFNIGGSVQNVLFMMGVQAVSTLTPFTPGGAGAQQALHGLRVPRHRAAQHGARLQRRPAGRDRGVQRGDRDGGALPDAADVRHPQRRPARRGGPAGGGGRRRRRNRGRPG